jgi:hypothetical protein
MATIFANVSTPLLAEDDVLGTALGAMDFSALGMSFFGYKRESVSQCVASAGQLPFRFPIR